MKAILALYVFLFASVAFAYPAVNDRATYTGTYTMGGVTQATTVAMTLVKYDSDKDAYLETQQVTIGSQTQTDERWVPASNYANQEVANDALTNCTKYGGKPEAIKTPAGEFKACHLVYESAEIYQDYWIADLPFAIAKIIQKNKKDGSVLDLAVESYSPGK